MFKFNAGRVESRMAVLIGFGFEEVNFNRMERHDPVFIRGSDIQLAGANFLVFYAGSGQDTFKANFDSLIEGLGERMGVVKNSKVNVVHNTDHNFFVAPLATNKEILFVVGLTDRSMKYMRDGKCVTYRVRLIDGEGDNHEVMMFWGKTADAMRQQFSEFIA